jgi:hypothetical protein
MDAILNGSALRTRYALLSALWSELRDSIIPKISDCR